MFLPSFDPAQKARWRIGGVPHGFEARLLAEAASRCPKIPVLFVAQDDRRAALVAEAMAFFSPSIEVLTFPAWDCLPYDRISPHTDILGERIATLCRFGKPFHKPAVVITTVNALAQKTLPRDALHQVSLDLAPGDEMPIEKLRVFLVASGFTNSGTVREQGEFAVRGGIVDLFPAGFENPVRIDFFGDEVEGLRLFDALSQTTIEPLDRLTLHPISEVLMDERTTAQFRSGYRDLFGAVMDSDPLYEAVTAGQKFPGVEHWLGLFYPRLASLTDYLPHSPVFFDAQGQEALAERYRQVCDCFEARQSLYQATKRAKKKDNQTGAVYKPVPVDRLYLSPDQVEQSLADRAVGFLSPFEEPEGDGALDALAKRGRDFADQRAQESDLYAAFQIYVREHQGRNRRVMIACYSQGSSDRLSLLLRNHNIETSSVAKDWEALRKQDPKRISFLLLGLEHGFVAPDMVVVTEQDILGERLIRQTKKRKAAAQFQMELGSLNPGDFVVHADHGIGRYEGLETINAMGLSHDCVKLIYDGGDKLFVPVENLEVLTRYGGAEGGAVLDKLGGVAWQARKARVKKRLLDMADALLKIAAERSLKSGEIVQVSEGLYQEFAARFPYNETDDQDRAIQSVLEDLASGKPMDRLVCGDVGFGKTEVALRAAFAAVQAGLQVAVVAPTTLLARQHYNNFVARFKGFPVKIGQLSRMVTTKEAKETHALMRSGELDIVIGTHALLAQDVAFDHLGLMIIDEEQHFGVKQKEKLKTMRTDVHVLTLTATPIPRTLQLALAGVRELSLITTPPVDRLAVRTFVSPFDPIVIREALMREHYRGGQSFYVCPRIEDLAGLIETLKELVPEIKMVAAHGRMNATQLDDIMNAFDARQFDLLLATNIIESGLDIPNANTMIVHRADMFGLAQLYQLRGRVGRAKLRGYAYLTYPATSLLSSTAQQRLEVLQTLDQLGAGFQLASHDMDIRGSGNLLGEAQSGHIREVGVELYQQMLEDAIQAAKAAGTGDDSAGQDRWTPQINVGMSVLIPETYVNDLNVRLGLYRRLAEGAGGDECEAMAAEMIDRFGPLPREVENLLQVVSIKQLCRQANIEKVDAGPKGAVISFRNNSFARPERLVRWIGEQLGTAKVRPDQKIALIRAWDDDERRLQGVIKLLTELADLAI